MQLYELDGDPERKEFLDDLFVFMQKRGECACFPFGDYLWSAYCVRFTLGLNSSPQSARVLAQEDERRLLPIGYEFSQTIGPD